MELTYDIKINDMSAEGIKIFQGLQNIIKKEPPFEGSLYAAMSITEEYKIVWEQVWEIIDCDLSSGTVRIMGLIKSYDPDSLIEFFLALHKKLIDAGSEKTRMRVHLVDEEYDWCASYLILSSDATSVVKDYCSINAADIHERVICDNSEIPKMRAEIYADLDEELDEDSDWDDILYPDHTRIMQSAIYHDFFNDHVDQSIEKFKEEMEEIWELET